MSQARVAGLGHAPAIVALAAMTLALFMTTPTGGDFWWYDASRHAMNGIFLRDFLMEGGLLHPLRFAREYYQQYPAINIGFYPPFMYIASVPFLAVFGASHAVSQSVVALHAMLAGVMIYLICQRMMDRWSALLVALAILALPDMALWARQVQLDVPALALLLCTAWALIHYLHTGSGRWLLVTAAFMGLAMLTRVQTGYAVPVVGLFALFHRTPQRPPLRTWLAAALLFLVLALPSVGSVFYFSKVTGNLAGAMPDMPALWSWNNWTWYARALPQQIGWPATWFIIAGLLATVATLRSGMPPAARVFAAFALSSWLFFTIVSNKEARFNLPSIPFTFMLAAYGMVRVQALLGRLLLLALAGWAVYQAMLFQVPVAQGYREAAGLAQAHTPPGENVLISAHRDGSVIFNMRADGKRRDIGTRRADKLFVEINIMRQLGIRDRELSQDAILKILNDQKIAVVVAQTGYLADQPSMQQFQRLLDNGGMFSIVGRVPLRGDVRKDERELVVYARK
ncbi:ArnT family glycosyltransferase [Noviherbaspirillum soli]|uniref:ArnT family glycosyltransferase n=1 Tax=Noviherbaspirillum soli TaxID=1064518 RepID=UPI00188BBCB0|nr:glycosyltransferase family 39 protein [Noviherbaspirillum soli]